MVLLSAGVSGQVLSTGSNNIGGLNRDNGTVGVGNQTGVGDSSGIGKSVVGSNNTVGGEVIGLGSSNSGLIYGDNGTVGVSDEGSGVVRISGMSIGISSIGVSSIWVSGVSSIGKSSVGKDSTTSGQMGGLGCGYGRLVSRDDGTVGVGDQLGRADSDAGGENQKLHVDMMCLR
jgi:hypothetical protein